MFGRITIKEVIGASPPAIPDMQDALVAELDIMRARLQNMDRPAVSRLLEEQRAAAAAVNSRPGAMALAQDKIRLFNEYHQNYVGILEDACKSVDT